MGLPTSADSRSEGRPLFCTTCGQPLHLPCQFCEHCGEPVVAVPTQHHPAPSSLLLVARVRRVSESMMLMIRTTRNPDTQRWRRGLDGSD